MIANTPSSNFSASKKAKPSNLPTEPGAMRGSISRFRRTSGIPFKDPRSTMPSKNLNKSSRSIRNSLDDLDNGDGCRHNTSVVQERQINTQKSITKAPKPKKFKPEPGSLSFFFPDAVTTVRPNQPSKAKISTLSSNVTSKLNLEPTPMPSLQPTIPLHPREAEQISGVFTPTCHSSTPPADPAPYPQLMDIRSLAESQKIADKQIVSNSIASATAIPSLIKEFFDIKAQMSILEQRYLDTKNELKEHQHNLDAESSAVPNTYASDLYGLVSEAESILAFELSERERMEWVLKDVQRECREPKDIPLTLQQLERRMACVLNEYEIVLHYVE
ncbi:hypothetical protein GYMLUDRAFT_754809 [Collybiopsis luxurians FD-317 M1]|uniref:Uncharacterized protein n=1 Tax=Collybiopsis luxurians FD-317 M1 TaxID=944289 RepID=A0A0D0B2E8_9AGAR|nr:hypothetical protein GYMLUDRAFT_754809 [Collybiopsis luxurians FD-317 M1]